MPTDSQHLPERLREIGVKQPFDDGEGGTDWLTPLAGKDLCHEAADRIAELEAEIEGWKASVNDQAATIARLEEALYSIRFALGREKPHVTSAWAIANGNLSMEALDG